MGELLLLPRKWRTVVRGQAWFAACVLLSAGCGGPEIKSFQVTPVPGGRPDGAITTAGLVEVCSGERVKARWETDGETALVLRLGDPRFAIHDDGDEADPLAPDTLEVTLVAVSGGEEEVKTVSVLQFPNTSRTVVAFPTELRGDTLVAAGERGEEDANKRLVVYEISNPLDRRLRISHAGKSEELSPGGTSNAFRGALLGGTWELRSLMTDEEHDNPLIRPTSLRITTTIHCKAGNE